ncbi:hypothetical protein PQI66_09640 [Corynebacterium sp. USCH3]|uniref:hypothetical protein n=1 Tax=Corynebacterium sp. USCH3 TaxID=3024840 RepID=UPI003099C544
MRKSALTVLPAAVAAALVVSACSAGDRTDAPSSSRTATTPVAETEQVPEQVAEPVPDTVVVHRPGMLDTALTAGDVPAWPGPDPAEFLEPDPPSGERGTISGDEAAEMYRAAQENPGTLLPDGQSPRDITDAVWWLGDEAQWLVVEPRW